MKEKRTENCLECKIQISRRAKRCPSCYLKHRTVPDEIRFWRYVRKTSTCWLWTGATVNGYGYFKNILTHRFSWQIHCGIIPSGINVLHHCDNRPCIRPDHLFIGTQQDNIDDMWRKNRGAFKLTPEAVNDIRNIYVKGKHLFLAKKYNVTDTTIRLIAQKRTWKYLLARNPCSSSKSKP